MEEFINRLNEEQKAFLNENIPNFENMETEDIVDWLSTYLQEEGIENGEVNDTGIFTENILDILGEL